MMKVDSLVGDTPGDVEDDAPDLHDPTFYTHSTYREKLVEHIFIAELLQEAWVKHRCVIEVLRSEIDASGFDVVLACGPVTRHIQLKAMKAGGRATKQNINLKLAEKPSGCVVWMTVDEDKEAGRIRLAYRFFGGAPGEPLPTLEPFPVAKRATHNKDGVRPERTGIREVPAKEFVPIENGACGLLVQLFGKDYTQRGC